MPLQLEEIYEKLSQIHWARDFISYIKFREKGLKKESQNKLRNFISLFKDQNKTERRSFTNTVFTITYLTGDYNVYLPHNLWKEFLLPEIYDWIKDEPNNPIPYMWSDKFEDNKKAVELDPGNQIALEKLGDSIVGKISMNQHELNSGYAYDGDPEVDIRLINNFEPYLKNIADNKKREKIKYLFTDLKKTAERYKKST